MTHDEQLDHYILPNYVRYDLWPVRGEGARVWDRDGKEYLDCASGVSVCPIGHCHPAVVKAITDQAKTLIHVSNWYCIDKQAELAEVLTEQVVRIPGKNFFSNSGAEANEGLLKLARRYAVQVRGIAKPKIITFTGSFHGRTMGAMFATAQQKIWGDFGFTPAELRYLHLPFNDVAALHNVFADHADIAAILIEPIQGESGVNAVTAEFLRTAQQLCRTYHALLLLDEVQCSLAVRATYVAGAASFQVMRFNPTASAGQRPSALVTRSVPSGCATRRSPVPRETHGTSRTSSAPARTAPLTAAARWPAPWDWLRFTSFSKKTCAPKPMNWGTT